MLVEPSTFSLGEHSFHIIGDELDQLLARQLRAKRRHVASHLTGVEVSLECTAHPASRAVQKYSLIGLADLENVTDLF